MSIAQGIYTIQSAAFDQLYIGRSLIEDFSLLPKGVFSISSNLTLPPPRNLMWTIAKPESVDFYDMKVGGASTAVIDNRLFAILLDEPAAELWHLERLPQYEGQYLIHTRNCTMGWVLPDEKPFTPVDVRPLTVLPSEPPQYPPNQRWILDRLD